MKKRTRKLSCLLLAVMLVASMTLPAMASSTTGSGTYGAYTYTWRVSTLTDRGEAAIVTTTTPGTVKAYVYCELYCSDCNKMHLVENRNTGYVSVTACVDNLYVKNGVTHDTVTDNTTGDFYINGISVWAGKDW